MLLFLVRHGQSEFNRLGSEAGSDSPLSELGWQQAERVGRFLQTRGPFDAFYTSPLTRALQTAQVIGRHVVAPPPLALDSLRESDFHLIEALPQFGHPFDVVGNGQPFSPLPEEYHQFRQQIESAIHAIVHTALEEEHQKILVVSHGGTMGTIIRTLIGCHRISVWSQNGCVHLLGWTDNRWEIRYMNRISFLEGL